MPGERSGGEPVGEVPFSARLDEQPAFLPDMPPHFGIKQHPGDTDAVIRERPGAMVSEKRYPAAAELEETARVARDEFRSLRSEYGLAVPPFEQIIGKDEEGFTAVYTRAARVVGMSAGELMGLKDATRIPRSELEGTLSGMLHYYADRYESGRPYVHDITTTFNQFVYGRVNDEGNPRLYLVDLDSYVGRETGGAGGADKLALTIYFLARMVSQAEQYLGDQLAEIRTGIAKMLSEFGKRGNVSDYYPGEILDALEGRGTPGDSPP